MKVFDTKLRFISNLAIVKLGKYKLPVAFKNAKGNKSKKHNVYISFTVTNTNKPRILDKLSKRYFLTLSKALFDSRKNEFVTYLKFTGEIIEASINDDFAKDYYTGYQMHGMHLIVKTKDIEIPITYSMCFGVDENGKMVGRNLELDAGEEDYFELPKVGDIITATAEVNGFLINDNGEVINR